MLLKVFTQVALLNELFLTFRAFVGFDPFVHPYMIQEVTGLSEVLLTVVVLADIGEGDLLKNDVFIFHSLMAVRFEQMEIFLIFRQVEGLDILLPLELLPIFLMVHGFNIPSCIQLGHIGHKRACHHILNRSGIFSHYSRH